MHAATITSHEGGEGEGEGKCHGLMIDTPILAEHRA